VFTVNELLKITRGQLVKKVKDLPIKGISIDSRTLRSKEAFIAIKGKNFDGHDFIKEAIKKGASCIIATEKIKGKVSFIKVKDTIKALGRIAHYQRKKFDLPVIAVTGSNGKTTAKEMIAWVLGKKFKVLKNEGTKNNQIGLPLTLLKLNSSHKIVVLELGTNHFGEIAYLAKICEPNIGIITNIGPAHLEYFEDLEGVYKEKSNLIKYLNKPSIAIFNSDDDILRKKIPSNFSNAFTLKCGIKYPAEFSASRIELKKEKVSFFLNKKYKFTLATPGRYNIYNALYAVSVARIFGMDYKEIALRLSNFVFPAGRLKIIKKKGIKFIDDTYNANPASLEEALRVLADFKVKGRKIFVMADMLELGKYKELFHKQVGEKVLKICDIFITVGKLSKLAAKVCLAKGYAADKIFICESKKEAKDILFNRLSLTKHDIVLLKGSRLMQMEELLNK